MERYCPPARRVLYPHSENRKEEAYVVDVTSIDQMLIKQKDHLLSMYNDMTNTVLGSYMRHRTRRAALLLLDLFRPTWELFDYEYKYHELYAMFDEYTIV